MNLSNAFRTLFGGPRPKSSGFSMNPKKRARVLAQMEIQRCKIKDPEDQRKVYEFYLERELRRK